MKTFGFGAFALPIALAGCATDAPVADRTEAAPVALAAVGPADTGATGGADIAAAAQVIANDFNRISGQNLGDGWQFDGASATGNRVDLTIEVPVAGRVYRNFDRPGDPLRDGLRRSNCRSETISAFLLLGGVMVVEVQGRDNVRIGRFRFDDPC